MSRNEISLTMLGSAPSILQRRFETERHYQLMCTLTAQKSMLFQTNWCLRYQVSRKENELAYALPGACLGHGGE